MSEEKLFQIHNIEDTPKFTPISEVSAHSIKAREKHFEEWIAKHPKLLFTDEEAVLVIAQEVSGEPMADILALDSEGNLIIIEAKREWSDRNTVGQILDYAAHLEDWDYDAFNARSKKYLGKDVELYDRFTQFVDNPDFPKEQLCKKQRLFIVAPDSDISLFRILEWLKQYDVPIDYIPFRIMKTGENKYILKVKQISVEPLPLKWGWKGDWFFNTNETYGKGAYRRMLERHVIAVYGYQDGKDRLDRPTPGNRIFMYVNNIGIIGVGYASGEESFPGTEIFGEKAKREYQRKLVNFKTVSTNNAIKAAEVTQMGYNLPVRSTLCKIYNPTVAERIHKELERKSSL
jgi:hypothetical protein